MTWPLDDARSGYERANAMGSPIPLARRCAGALALLFIVSAVACDANDADPSTIDDRSTTTMTVTRTVTTSADPGTTPAPDGFMSREEALDRPEVVVESGTISTQYLVESLPPSTTYDLRGLTVTSAEEYPLSFGASEAGEDTVVVGGTVEGQMPRDISWEEAKDEFDGAALRIEASGSQQSFDLRADNVFDGYRPKPDGDAVEARYLLEGCHLTWVRDDAVEVDDPELTGTIRDCLFDGINTGLSIGQNEPNEDAVTTIEDSIFLFTPMRNDRADDGSGHQALFKQMPGGAVAMSNVVICYPEDPISPSRLEIWPPGSYSNVRIVLGSDFAGSFPAEVPDGVSVTTDWSICSSARDAWLGAY